MSQLNPAFIFWQHDVVQTIPNNTWTPLLLNLNRTSRPNGRSWARQAAIGSSVHVEHPTAATTIAAGSNGQALPQGTINVASTAAFASAGFLAIRIGGTDRVIAYTGKNATQFTGCTLGVGTMTTNDPIRQGVAMFCPPFPAIAQAVAEVRFAGNATGQRGIRFHFGGLGLTGGTTLVNAGAIVSPISIQTVEQPAFAGLNESPDFVQVFQDSGGNLDTVLDGLGAPRLVAITLGGYTGEPGGNQVL